LRRWLRVHLCQEHTQLPPNPVAGHTPEKEGPTPDAATHWLSFI
jgi:hypothetical protein